MLAGRASPPPTLLFRFLVFFFLLLLKKKNVVGILILEMLPRLILEKLLFRELAEGGRGQG